MQPGEKIKDLEKRLLILEEKLAAASSITNSIEIQTSNQKDFIQVLDTLAAEIKIVSHPQFFVGATALSSIDIPSLFEGRNEPIVRLFDSPPEVRSDGFNLYQSDHRSAI